LRAGGKQEDHRNEGEGEGRSRVPHRRAEGHMYLSKGDEQGPKPPKKTHSQLFSSDHSRWKRRSYLGEKVREKNFH